MVTAWRRASASCQLSMTSSCSSLATALDSASHRHVFSGQVDASTSGLSVVVAHLVRVGGGVRVSLRVGSGSGSGSGSGPGSGPGSGSGSGTGLGVGLGVGAHCLAPRVSRAHVDAHAGGVGRAVAWLGWRLLVGVGATARIRARVRVRARARVKVRVGVGLDHMRLAHPATPPWAASVGCPCPT